MFSFSWTLELDIRADLLSRFDGLHFDASILPPSKVDFIKGSDDFQSVGIEEESHNEA